MRVPAISVLRTSIIPVLRVSIIPVLRVSIIPVLRVSVLSDCGFGAPVTVWSVSGRTRGRVFMFGWWQWDTRLEILK